MKQSVIIMTVLLCVALPACGKTHHDKFTVPCSQLWPAVRDALDDALHYAAFRINDTSMSASYIPQGEPGTKRRVNSVVLKADAGGCEMQVDSHFRGLLTHDVRDFHTRVEASLAKLKTSVPNAAKKE